MNTAWQYCKTACEDNSRRLQCTRRITLRLCKNTSYWDLHPNPGALIPRPTNITWFSNAMIASQKPRKDRNKTETCVSSLKPDKNTCTAMQCRCWCWCWRRCWRRRRCRCGRRRWGCCWSLHGDELHLFQLH